MQNISIILATLTTFTTRGQTENEKIGSDMSISLEVPGDVDSLYGVFAIEPYPTDAMFDNLIGEVFWWVGISETLLPRKTNFVQKALCEHSIRSHLSNKAYVKVEDKYFC